MENQQLIQLIREELPDILRRDRALREWVLELTRTQYADQAKTESRFDRVLDELSRDREAQERKWAENQQALRQLQEEGHQKWEAQERKWAENQVRSDQRFDSLMKKIDSTIGALGARWGLHSEQSFRHALEGILADSFGVEVINVTEYDDAGDVFGRPDQVELDVIIQDGTLILVEIKSSMSKADVYIFDRKVAFYEKHHGRQASRKLVISPMVEEAAGRVATRLGIEVYSHAEDAAQNGQ